MRERLAAAFAVFVIVVSLIVLGPTAPAQANGACSSNQLCLYGCFLSESCNAWFRSTVAPGCYPTGATGLIHLTYSVKNNTSKNIVVYHTTNCSASGGTSTLWAHTSGNMNNEWIGAGIKSFRVP